MNAVKISERKLIYFSKKIKISCFKYQLFSFCVKKCVLNVPHFVLFLSLISYL